MLSTFVTCSGIDIHIVSTVLVLFQHSTNFHNTEKDKNYFSLQQSNKQTVGQAVKTAKSSCENAEFIFVRFERAVKDKKV